MSTYTLEQLDNYDWGEVFGYADGTKESPYNLINKNTKGNPAKIFTIDDVEKILYLHEGENDRDNWVGVFKLRDKRYAYISAGCDYTGWG